MACAFCAQESSHEAVVLLDGRTLCKCCMDYVANAVRFAGKVQWKTTGKDIYYLGIFGLLFLAALLAFLPEEILFSRLVVLVILIPVLNFVAILLWIKLILVWMGIVEKM